MVLGFTSTISARHWLQLVPSGHSSSVSAQTFSFFCDGTERLLQMVKTVRRGHPHIPLCALCSVAVTVGDCIYTADQAKRVKYAYDKGHQVASHTWAHKNLTTLNWDQSESGNSFTFKLDYGLSPYLGVLLVHHEMWLAEEAIWKITGAYPAFVRPRKNLIGLPPSDIEQAAELPNNYTTFSNLPTHLRNADDDLRRGNQSPANLRS